MRHGCRTRDVERPGRGTGVIRVHRDAWGPPAPRGPLHSRMSSPPGGDVVRRLWRKGRPARGSGNAENEEHVRAGPSHQQMRSACTRNSGNEFDLHPRLGESVRPAPEARRTRGISTWSSVNSFDQHLERGECVGSTPGARRTRSISTQAVENAGGPHQWSGGGGCSTRCSGPTEPNPPAPGARRTRAICIPVPC